MEHYFLFIYNEVPNSEETSFLVNYIKSLLPQLEVLNHLHTVGLLPELLKCSSFYLSVLSSCAKLDDNFEWKIKNSDVGINDFILDSFKNIPENQDAEIRDKSRILSSHINSLADHLPSYGSYKLDVVLNCDVLTNFSVSDDLEFASALYRLFTWHGAHTTIIVSENNVHLNLKEWCKILDAEFLHSKLDTSLSTVVWRGSLQLSHPNQTHATTYPGFQFRLDAFESEILLNNTVSTGIEDTEPEHLVLSPTLLILDECSFPSIPPYMLLPLSFRLSISEPNMFNQNSIKLCEILRNKNGAALIVRMSYSIVPNKPEIDKSLSTSKWQKMVSSGNIKFPDICLPVVEKCITLVITKSTTSDSIVVCPLRDPTQLNAELNFRMIDATNSKQNPKCEAMENENVNCVDVKLPHLTEAAFYTLVNKINAFKANKKCDSNESNLQEDSYVWLLSVLKSASESSVAYSLFKDVLSCRMYRDERDPADWPERVHLLQKQLEIEAEKKDVLPNFLHNLSPQLTQHNVSFSSEDITKRFEITGESKESIKAEPITQFNLKSKLSRKEDYGKVLQSQWPEITKYVYPDLHYNCDKQCEEKESVGNEMVRFYVQHETATTCNRQQLNPNSSVVVRSKVQVPKQKWRSPMKQRPLSKKSLNLVYKSYIDSNQPSSSKLKSSSNLTPGTMTYSELKNRFKKNMTKKAAVPVRCSPRKKKPVIYSNPATSSKSATNKQQSQSSSQQLPEISKKKLRVAIVGALEKNGVSLNDAFFRPCFKKLFTVCQAFVQDLPHKKGSTSERMQKIADAHVKQVIEFERQK